MNSGITFDDVLIVPGFSDIETRQDIDTSVGFLGRTLTIPIISANMDYVTGLDMVAAMYSAGGMGILHRFADHQDQIEWTQKLNAQKIPFWMSVGIRSIAAEVDWVEVTSMMLPFLEGVCIDVAQGHHAKVATLIKAIKNVTNIKVIAGNIATAEGARYLVDAGADAIKVGIGAGAVCTTRTVAGVGVPQLSAILDVAEADLGVPIIADGGIRGSADIAKALIAGATTVMVGSILAGADECPTPILRGADGLAYKAYRGQSIFGSNGERYVAEGIEGYVPVKGPVAGILRNLQAGLRSSMSYVGAHNIKELQLKGKFTLVSGNTQHENSTRVRTTI